MVWYPGATRMELQPESDAQPAIRPTQLIAHSIAAPWTTRRIFEYWRDSTNLESHFGLAYTGELGQYIGTQTRADANYRANRRSDGTGAASVETASDLKHTDPWTDQQITALVHLGVWMHTQHQVPLRICRTWDDPGYGYHRLFPEWSTGGTACPGDTRVTQFRTEVFPEIARQADAATAPVTAPVKPRVSLAHVVAAGKRDPGLAQGGTTWRADVLIVERALEDEGLLSKQWASDGSYGSATVTAYAALQRRYGYRGKDADGIAGMASLTRLGTKHGFTIKA